MILHHVQCGQRKEGTVPVRAWKTAWQRKHSGWASEKETGLLSRGRKRGECLVRGNAEKDRTFSSYSIG